MKLRFETRLWNCGRTIVIVLVDYLRFSIIGDLLCRHCRFCSTWFHFVPGGHHSVLCQPSLLTLWLVVIGRKCCISCVNVEAGSEFTIRLRLAFIAAIVDPFFKLFCCCWSNQSKLTLIGYRNSSSNWFVALKQFYSNHIYHFIIFYNTTFIIAAPNLGLLLWRTKFSFCTFTHPYWIVEIVIVVVII